MASSPSRTNLFGLRARTAATISGKPEVRLLPVLDCKEMVSSSRKTRQRNPSHFGSYIHSLPIGKLFTARAFAGEIVQLCLVLVHNVIRIPKIENPKNKLTKLIPVEIISIAF